MLRWFFWIICATTLPVMAHAVAVPPPVPDQGRPEASPEQLRISPNGRQITYLLAAGHGPNLELWSYTLATKHRQRLLTAAQLSWLNPPKPGQQPQPIAEQASDGAELTDYQWSPDSQQLLLPVHGQLYLYQPSSQHWQHLATAGPVSAVRFSPHGHYISYVQAQNLWVLNLHNGQRQALSHAGGGHVHMGQAEWLARNEMQRQEGYWWSPDERYIAVERYDASAVTAYLQTHLPRSAQAGWPADYPLAGSPNVSVGLGLIQVAGGPIRWLDLGPSSDIYLTDVRWRPDGRMLTYQRMSRNQQQLDLQAVAMPSLIQRTLITETSDDWLNLHHDLYFLSDNDFIWGSERTGFYHLYEYDPEGRLRHPLSTGRWPVNRLLAVDAHHHRLFISSNRDTIVEQHIYSLPLNTAGDRHPQQLSQQPGIHHALFSPQANFFIDTWCNPLTPPQISLYTANGRFIDHIWSARRGAIATQKSVDTPPNPPEFGELTSTDGQTLYYRLYKPTHFNPLQRYPIIDSISSGPGMQAVRREWGDQFNQWMADQGWIVFSLDSRGSSGRGHRFELPLYQQLSTLEVEDQLIGIHWLKMQAWADPSRIGIIGWQYGAYLSLMLLAKAGEQVQAGVVIDPISDWQWYNSLYSERYLGRPQDNPGNYIHSSTMAWLDGLTSNILVLHGSKDDPVLNLNNQILQIASKRQGRPLLFADYAGGQQGIQSSQVLSDSLYPLIYDFLKPLLYLPSHRADTVHP